MLDRFLNRSGAGMQIEEQDEHSLNGHRELRGRQDASVFPYGSQELDVDGQHMSGGWEKWGRWEEWDGAKSNDVQDIYKSLPVTPASSHMPDMPPLFSLPTLLTPQVPDIPHKNKEEAVSPEHVDNPPPQTASMTHNGYVDMVEQAIDRLNDAARRIAAVEQNKDRRSPKASRLAPLHDISGEIQRQSTPMPNTPSTPEASFSSSGESPMPDLWPWIPDTEENEQDIWANHTDPLVRRRFPDRHETARIEQEDVRRARAEGFRVSFLRRKHVKIQGKRLRLLFGCLAVMAICALLIDAALVSLTFSHSHRTTPAVVNGPPTLTLSVEGASDNKVRYGQNITLHLRHFTPLSKVYLTHDVEQPILLGNSSPFVTVSRTGAANVTTAVDTVNWNPGFHSIDAEDYTTRYTANATLEIVDSGPTHPSHLIINTQTLDFQSGIQGSNTIEPLTLSNDGNAAISWAASSDASWLVLTPNQGIFSKTETIEVGVQRGTLAPGDYTGKITFSSNVGSPIVVAVTMSVSLLPPNAGPVLMVTPAVLSFTAQDGDTNPGGQELVVSNPGTQQLSWSLTNNVLSAATDQNSFLTATDTPTASWLNVSQTSGTVDPKATNIIHINVQSQNLLPGAYIDTLLFTAGGSSTLNKTESVSISLTVTPQCGLTLSTGIMSFTSVANSTNSTVQPLNVGATSGCSMVKMVNWQASSSASWLQITPASGQVSPAKSSVISVSVNTGSMAAGSYPGTITVTNGTSTQSVQVTLLVQSPPPPTAPIMSASPLSLSFTAIQGQSNVSQQTVVISNTGQSALKWNEQAQELGGGWLGASPTGNVINPGQTGQMVVTVNASSLTPGNYTGQVILSGTDTSPALHIASGSPQTIMVQLTVLPPCGLQAPSSAALAFTATQGGSNPAPQSVTFTAQGSCSWPVNWQAHITSHANWLMLSALSGSISASGQAAPLTASVNVGSLPPGTYTTQVSIAASDSASIQAQGSPQVFSVTLTIQPACQLQASGNTLNFSTPTGQVSATQDITIQESGNCARPVSWTATGNSGSSSWLIFSPPGGSDNGAGATISVSVNANTLAPGSYSGTITISASGTGSSYVQGSPITVAINATVAGVSVSGTVNACTASPCTSSVPLAGATVSLVNASGATIASATTGATGTYSIPNVALGSYTVSVSGTNTSGTHYTGTVTANVTGNMPNINVNALPG
ncbi:MAG TPA: hypothetical protein DHW02_20455 [Ktedonobacter sp.]|nr:hypothetical protein [Ktedonobacter sp.]